MDIKICNRGKLSITTFIRFCFCICFVFLSSCLFCTCLYVMLRVWKFLLCFPTVNRTRHDRKCYLVLLVRVATHWRTISLFSTVSCVDDHRILFSYSIQRTATCGEHDCKKAIFSKCGYPCKNVSIKTTPQSTSVLDN